MFRPVVAIVLAAFALAGGSSVEASTPTSQLATPSLPCTLPYGTRVQVVAPSAATPPGTILLVASRELPKTVSLVATDRKGGVVPVVSLERLVRLRRSVKTPAFANPVYYRASGVALRTHRHYTLALDDLAQNGCAPYAELDGDARIST
jgi:hypothetical protein